MQQKLPKVFVADDEQAGMTPEDLEAATAADNGKDVERVSDPYPLQPHSCLQ